MRPFLIGFGLLLICLVSETRAAGNITLAWDPNLEPNVAGYRLHYGTASGSYTKQINIGKTTSATVRHLTAGATYFFVVTAYNTAGHESPPSYEISYPSPDRLQNISARGLIQIGDRVLIDGFLVTGNGQKKVMVRALGPSLPVPSAVSD